jgi:23S rRNA pseudouridine1911/1915/1917 synthase
MADECDVSRPGIVHRLDKDTSGVMVIALNARAHASLSDQFQNREIEKYYYAFCDGIFQKHEDDIECMIARDRNDRKLFTAVKEQREYIIQGGLSAKRTAEIENEVYNDPKYRIGGSLDRIQGKYSKSHYEVVRQLPQAALVKVRIFTGRTHQIRVHMKYIGHPVIGDVMYNNRLSRFPGEPLMLHSSILEINHPTTGERMHFESPVPKRFSDLEQKLRES